MLGYSIDEDGAIVLRSRESLVAFSSPRFAVWGYAANTRVSCEQNDNLIGDNEGSFVCYSLQRRRISPVLSQTEFEHTHLAGTDALDEGYQP